jgi:glutamyl-tRNA synthetase
VLIFEAAGAAVPQFAHLPLLIAPDGAKLSKRKHGPVVSVTTYRDAGFLPEAFVNFLCLLGWSPKNDREMLTREELIDLFSLEGINRANAVVNFKEPAEILISRSTPSEKQRGVAAYVVPRILESYPDEMFDPKAIWLNAEHIRALPVPELSAYLLPFARERGWDVTPEKMLEITPLIRERIKLLRDVRTAADFFFVDALPSQSDGVATLVGASVLTATATLTGDAVNYDPNELIPQKGDKEMALKALKKAREVLAATEFKHDALDAALRAAAQELGLKAGQMFQPIRVAVCGRKNAPPLFGTLEVVGKEDCLRRIDAAILAIRK